MKKMKKFWFTVDDLNKGYTWKCCLKWQQRDDGIVGTPYFTLVKKGNEYRLPNYCNNLRQQYTSLICNLKDEKLIKEFGTSNIDEIL